MVYNTPMKRAKSVFPVFLLLLVISAIVFSIQGSLLKPLQAITVPIQTWMFTTFSAQALGPAHTDDSLREENNALRTQLAIMQELERDNNALRDQFETTSPSPKKLLPAMVIGVNQDQLMVDKGEQDGIMRGDIVVVKDNVIGKVETVSPRVSVIRLITHPTTSFTAQTAKTAAIGVVKAQGGDSITLENVVLSDKLEKNDLIKTKGDVDEQGGGFPPDLIIGKIISVSKKDSNLFQVAQIRSLVDLNRLRIVFILRNP